MPRKLISSGSPFEEQMAYSRAVVDGEWVFVSGTTGFDYSTMSISENPAEQAEQCILNIQNALLQANASLKDVVRVRYILSMPGDFEKCWPVRIPAKPVSDSAACRYTNTIHVGKLNGRVYC